MLIIINLILYCCSCCALSNKLDLPRSENIESSKDDHVSLDCLGILEAEAGVWPTILGLRISVSKLPIFPGHSQIFWFSAIIDYSTSIITNDDFQLVNSITNHWLAPPVNHHEFFWKSWCLGRGLQATGMGIECLCHFAGECFGVALLSQRDWRVDQAWPGHILIGRIR